MHAHTHTHTHTHSHTLTHTHTHIHTHTHTHRCRTALRHYRVLWDGRQFCFGLGKFPDVATLSEHFRQQPMISGDCSEFTSPGWGSLVHRPLPFLWEGPGYEAKRGWRVEGVVIRASEP